MKLPNGYGSVVKLSGKRRKPYAVRISYETMVDGKPVRKQKYIEYFLDKKNALNYLSEYNQGHIVKEHASYGCSLTFNELFEKWCEFRQGLKSNPSESTWRNYKIAYGMFSPVHDKKIASMRSQELQECINLQHGKSRSTVGNMRVVIKGMWEYALNNNLAEEDITKSLYGNGLMRRLLSIPISQKMKLSDCGRISTLSIT